tara:strand:+ start:171 stop:374 length:204 start_codon:yes stop_codon:yes gene_type:complete
MKIEIDQDKYEQIRLALITAEIALTNVATDMKSMKLNILHQFRLEQAKQMREVIRATELKNLNVNYL